MRKVRTRTLPCLTPLEDSRVELKAEWPEATFGKESSAIQLVWDLGFLVWGTLMLVGGVTLMRAGDRETKRDTVTVR